jgi:hypothetical protein
MNPVREDYEDLVAECERNLDTVNYAAEQMHGCVWGRSYDYRRDRLEAALEWYRISVEKLVAFQREQEKDPQLDSYDFEHLTRLCVSHRDTLRNMNTRMRPLLSHGRGSPA